MFQREITSSLKKWKEDEECYYHIYFDDDKIEKKRNYLAKNDKVSKIKIILIIN